MTYTFKEEIDVPLHEWKDICIETLKFRNGWSYRKEWSYAGRDFFHLTTR